jgi:hypothetical protein
VHELLPLALHARVETVELGPRCSTAAQQLENFNS